jgi:hypothetical protein
VYLFAQALWLDVRSPERVPADGLEILHRVFHRQARAFPTERVNDFDTPRFGI